MPASGRSNGIAVLPSNLTHTGVQQPVHPRDKTHGPNQRKGADLRVRKYLLQASRGSQQCSALGYDIIDEHDLSRAEPGRGG